MDPVLGALARAARKGLMPSGSSLLLAVSGGADSMALLYGSAEVARGTGWKLSVGHVHHGLRGREADRDLAFVAGHARRLALPFFSRRRDAAREARERKLSPEAAARFLRYEALAEIAREAGASLIAVAHQRSDVAETHRLARERRYGLAALAGPRERRADGVVRPLLGVRRQEVLAFLSARGIVHRRDASNGDLRFSRNRIRRELAAAANGLGSVEELARDAFALVPERERLDHELAEQALPRLFRGPGVTITDAVWLSNCPRELARLALALAATPFALPGRSPFTGPERERILDRLWTGADFRFEAGRRIRFERRGGILRVRPRPAADSRDSRDRRV